MVSSEGEGGPVHRIGEVLVSQGKVTEDQVHEAARSQGNGSLGKALVTLGYISDDDLAKALAAASSVEYVAPEDLDADPEVRGIISQDVLEQHNSVPLRIDGGRLIVAMSDPDDLYARSDLTISAGFPVTPVVAAAAAVRELRQSLFAGVETEEAVADSGVDIRSLEDMFSGVEDDAEEPEANGSSSGDEGRSKGTKIGDILISEGKISEEQLTQALELQRSDPRDLGKILVSLGYVSGIDLAQALARRLKVDYVVLSELSEGEFDPAVLDVIDEESLRKYLALPLRYEDDRLVVAMSDPNDLFALEDLRLISRHPITPVVAAEEDLLGAYSALFGGDETQEQVAAVVEEDVSAPEEASPGPTDAPEPPVEARRGGDPEQTPEPVAAEPQEQAGGETAEDEPPAPEAEPQGNAAEDRPQGPGPAGTEVAPPGMGLEHTGKRRVGLGTGKIGDILVQQGKISDLQLQEALEVQKHDPREVGKILISMGYIAKSDLAEALAKRLRLGYMELTDEDVDRGVVLLVEQKVLRRHGVLPLRIEDGRLLVAMSDPTNIFALEDLMMISGYPITPVVALEEDIQRVQNRIFAIGEDVEEILQEAGREGVADDHGEIDLGETSPDEAPVVRLVGSILQKALGDGASDIHIEPRARELTVRMRVDGVLRETMSIPPKLQSGVIARLKIVANLNIAEKRVPQDGRFSVKLGGQKMDLRVASLPTVYGEKVVLRLLDTSNATVELPKLGFPVRVYSKYEEVFRRPYGAVLVTGPTGSGKSTTLYATLNELNTPEKNIITVEDPVEFRMRGVNQVQTNPRAGLTFSSALKSILRADPDIVMIGEIRDKDTAQIAIEASLTGHLVLSTLHTNDAPGALSRLTDMGIEPFLTASAVDCVIAQRLARRLCPNCKEPVEIEREILEGMQFPFEHLDGRELNLHKAVGCGRCGNSGYKGRVGLYELMVVSEEIRSMLMRRASSDEVGRRAIEDGMIPLRQDGLLKAAEGITTIEEILRTVV